MQTEFISDLFSKISAISQLSGDAPLANLVASYDDILQTALMIDDMLRSSISFSKERELAARLKISQLKAELDSRWAKQIIDDEESLLKLREYPYLDDSWVLVNRELVLAKLTGATIDDKSKMLIIGEDSLPLTTCQLLQQTGGNVTVYSYDKGINDTAAGVARVLGLATHSQFAGVYSSDLQLADTYDLIILNPLVGQNLKKVIDNLKNCLRLSGRLIIRSATGVRSLMMSTIGQLKFNGLQLLAEYNPVDNVVQSSLIYRKQNDV